MSYPELPICAQRNRDDCKPCSSTSLSKVVLLCNNHKRGMSWGEAYQDIHKTKTERRLFLANHADCSHQTKNDVKTDDIDKNVVTTNATTDTPVPGSANTQVGLEGVFSSACARVYRKKNKPSARK